ncbi:ATP-binding protein [Streptomyces sp. NPDC086783]|uniref:ATP-binding protein n=1 Tax=Streptomyces sp. NPDC086783 TaxID=3365758 RepID=UPI0037F9B3EF
MPAWTPDAACGLLAAGLLTLTFLLVRLRRAAAHHRDRAARLAERLRAWEEEVRHLVAVRLPGPEALSEARGRPRPAPADGTAPSGPTPPPGPARPFVDTGPLDARLAGTGLAACLDSVLERFTAALGQAGARADSGARAVLGEAARALLDLADEQQAAIAAMQHRYDDPDVLGDLLGIDHANARLARRAGALAVLGGSAPERRRDPAALTDVVRGAASRIRDYRRIRVGGASDVMVTGPAVDPLVLAVAELLDNAARHSPPGTTVEAGVRAVPGGACVVIDDAGSGLDGEAAQYAAELLAGFRPVDLTRLGDPPRFGFAVVGTLAARHGLAVSVDTRSPYGGLRAVVLLPPALLEPPATGTGDAGAAGKEGGAAGGLPRRRRRTRRGDQGEGSGKGARVADLGPVSGAGTGRGPGGAGSGLAEGAADTGSRVGVQNTSGVESTGGDGEVEDGRSASGVGNAGEAGRDRGARDAGEAGSAREGERADADADDAVRAAERNALRMNAFASGLRRGRAETATATGADVSEAGATGVSASGAGATEAGATGVSASGAGASAGPESADETTAEPPPDSVSGSGGAV